MATVYVEARPEKAALKAHRLNGAVIEDPRSRSKCLA